MSALKIRVYGDPVLRMKAEPVSASDPSTKQLVADMEETMYRARGVGLAANQVGVTKRVVTLDVDQVESSAPNSKSKRKINPARRKLQVYLNPEIVERSVEDGPYREACLSLPGLEGEVYRPLEIHVRYQDLDGTTHDVEAKGVVARVLQHEIDHLDGIMFVDRMDPAKRRTLAGELARLRKIAAENPQGIPPEQANE